MVIQYLVVKSAFNAMKGFDYLSPLLEGVFADGFLLSFIPFS
jgi:hypothetical protein